MRFSTVVPPLVENTITKGVITEKCPSHKRGARRLTLPKNYSSKTIFHTHIVELTFFNASMSDATMQRARYPSRSVNYSSVTPLSQCRRKTLRGKHGTQGMRLLSFLEIWEFLLANLTEFINRKLTGKHNFFEA